MDIQAAESLIGCPEVIEGSFEKRTNYWCYLCSCDVERHAYDGQVTLKLAKFIEHLCSESHSLAAPKFYRLHHVEPGMVKQRLVFSQEDYERFKNKLVQALDQYEDKTYAKLQESVAKIRKVEAERQAIMDNREAFPGSKGCGVDTHVGTASVEHGEGSDKFALSRSLNYAAGRPKVLNKVRTIAVVSSGGLASIGTHTAAAREGNVHSGATPPWLRESSDPTRARDEEGKQSEVGGIIGPTAEDFQKDCKISCTT
ncbi:centrosomal AT-AC splicing factor-like [Diadema setosum]|uniref:centrosomal AT-AC splicing factor-like n=1 Tax=Diadema setosum TaxID=31175 RepID=UPI003B3A4517